MAASQSQLAIVKPNPACEDEERCSGVLQRETEEGKRGGQKSESSEKWGSDQQYRETLVPHIRFPYLSLSPSHTHTHSLNCQLNTPCSCPKVVTHLIRACITRITSNSAQTGDINTPQTSLFVVFFHKKHQQLIKSHHSEAGCQQVTSHKSVLLARLHFATRCSLKPLVCLWNPETESNPQIKKKEKKRNRKHQTDAEKLPKQLKQ